jgi:hypothetical protein
MIDSQDDENPEWTEADFAQAKPALEVLASYIGEAAAEALLRDGKNLSPNKTRTDQESRMG